MVMISTKKYLNRAFTLWYGTIRQDREIGSRRLKTYYSKRVVNRIDTLENSGFERYFLQVINFR